MLVHSIIFKVEKHNNSLFRILIKNLKIIIIMKHVAIQNYKIPLTNTLETGVKGIFLFL
jgi:hypothetical protein